MDQVTPTQSTGGVANPKQAGKPQKSGLAVTSFVLGIVSFIPLIGVLLGILAIIFGVLGRREAVSKNLRGKKMSVVGIVLGVCGILFTIFVYGSLFYWGFVAKTGPFVELKVEASQGILTQDAGQLELYKRKFGKYPQTLKEASDAGYSIFGSDHYLRPFSYQVSEDGQSYDLRSLGADGEYGTEDDVFPKN